VSEGVSVMMMIMMMADGEHICTYPEHSLVDGRVFLVAPVKDPTLVG
jgi:hypothetical protein